MLEVMTAREIDAVIAELAFGQPIPSIAADFDLAPIGIWRSVDVYSEAECRWECPEYSTDPAASYQLRQRMREKDWLVIVEDIRYPQRAYRARARKFMSEVTVMIDADTEMMAVALACCAAMGRPVELRA